MSCLPDINICVNCCIDNGIGYFMLYNNGRVRRATLSDLVNKDELPTLITIWWAEGNLWKKCGRLSSWIAGIELPAECPYLMQHLTRGIRDA